MVGMRQPIVEQPRSWVSTRVAAVLFAAAVLAAVAVVSVSQSSASLVGFSKRAHHKKHHTVVVDEVPPVEGVSLVAPAPVVAVASDAKVADGKVAVGSAEWVQLHPSWRPGPNDAKLGLIPGMFPAPVAGAISGLGRNVPKRKVPAMNMDSGMQLEEPLFLGGSRKYKQRMDWANPSAVKKPIVAIIGDSISSGCCCSEDINGVEGAKYYQVVGPGDKRKYYAGNGFAQRLHDSSDMKDYEVRITSGSGRTAMASSAKCGPLTHHEHDVDENGVAAGFNHPTVWQDINGLISESPDMVLLMLGTNDAYSDWPHCQAKFVNDYTKLIQLFTSMPDPPRVRLMIPPIFGSEAGPTDIIKSKLPGKIRQIAKAAGLPPPIDLQTVMTGYDTMNHNGFDIHPTCKGHQLIENKIMDTLYTPEAKAEDVLHMARRQQSSYEQKFKSFIENVDLDVPGVAKFVYHEPRPAGLF